MSIASVVESPLRQVRAFPGLARVVRAGRGAREAARWWRSTVAGLSALGEAKLSGFRTAGERARALSRLAGEVLAIHGVEVVPIGLVPDRPCLIVANQSSRLDPLAVLSQVAAVPILRTGGAAWPGFERAVTALGARAGDDAGDRAHVLRGALDALRAGVSVLALSEPTRAPVAPFQRDVFGLAVLADLPVVPVALRVAARGASTRVTMIARAPMWARPGETADELALRVRTAIAVTLHPAPRPR